MASAHTTSRSLALLAAAALASAALAGCAPAADRPAPGDSASASATPAPSESATDAAEQLDWPNVALSTQVGAALFNPPGSEAGVATGESTAGPALIAAGSTVRITGDCVGSRMAYELRTAQAGEDQRVLVDDVISCGGESSSTHDGLDYVGVVQLSITDANGADAGWVQATLEP
jgi:hypothetical protein